MGRESENGRTVVPFRMQVWTLVSGLVCFCDFGQWADTCIRGGRVSSVEVAERTRMDTDVDPHEERGSGRGGGVSRKENSGARREPDGRGG